MSTQGVARPILFSGQMIRAILDNRKIQTRRVVKPQPNKQHIIVWASYSLDFEPGFEIIGKYGSTVKAIKCPYGQPGDLLWVRETWAEYMGHPVYRADGERSFNDGRGLLAIGPWRPSIHMPRGASRLTLRITDVRVQRLQDINEGDAWAEGFPYGCDSIDEFRDYWDSLNAKRGYSWESNPYVWVLEFERCPT